MQTLTNSRFITYPDLVEKTTSHTIMLIDPTESEIEDVGLFCRASNLNYDIYLYNGQVDDLPWLSSATDQCDSVLINNNSRVKSNSAKRYGADQEIISPLAYIQKLDEIN